LTGKVVFAKIANMKTTTFFNKLRAKYKLKQKDMAKELKISQVNLCKYERGITEPSPEFVLSIIEKKLNIKIFP